LWIKELLFDALFEDFFLGGALLLLLFVFLFMAGYLLV
jgi:hypothetical protein